MNRQKSNFIYRLMIVLVVMMALSFVKGGDVEAAQSSSTSAQEEVVMSDIPNVEHVIIPEGVTRLSIEYHYPDLPAVKKLTIPNSLKHIRKEWLLTNIFPNLEEIIIDTNHPYFSYQDGILYELNAKGQEISVIAVLKEKINTDVILPSTVYRIDSGAFKNCGRLRSITFSREFLFFSSLLDEEWEGNVISQEFRGCVNLCEFKVEKGNVYYCADNGVLFDKEKQVLYAFPHAYKGIYRVPDGVMTIQSFAFYECNQLRKILIPDGVTMVGHQAFYCCKNLKKIKFLSPYVPKKSGEIIYKCGKSKIYVPKGLGKTYKEKMGLKAKMVKEGTYQARKKKITKLDKPMVKSSSGISLWWLQIPYAEGYRVQMKKGNQWITIATIKDPTKTTYGKNGKKLGMKDGELYRFRVVAYRGEVKSISVSRVGCYIGKRKVTAAHTAKGTITVKWNADKALTGYKIRIRATDNSFEKEYIVKSGRKHSTKITGLEPGKKYVIRVTGYKQKNKNQWESNMNPMLKVLVEK